MINWIGRLFYAREEGNMTIILLHTLPFNHFHLLAGCGSRITLAGQVDALQRQLDCMVMRVMHGTGN